MKSMVDREVWRKTERKKIPNDRRLIGNKWVFNIKRDGTYRARLVALRYSEIPGVDYTDNFAPVAHDVTFRIALARMMVEKLDSLVMDVETAFLYGEIDEEIFVEKLQFSLFLISCCPEILYFIWLLWYLLLKIACLHVSFTAYENFYKLSKMHCLLVWFSTFQLSEVSENRDPTIKHIFTYTLISSSISTYVIDLFLVILFT